MEGPSHYLGHGDEQGWLIEELCHVSGMTFQLDLRATFFFGSPILFYFILVVINP